MATQPQFDTPQLRGIAQLMSSFADMAAQDRQDERDLMALFDPREQAKRKMEGALALAEIQQGQDKLGLDARRLDLDEKLGFAELEGLNEYRKISNLLESIKAANTREGNILDFLNNPYTPALMTGQDPIALSLRQSVLPNMFAFMQSRDEGIGGRQLPLGVFGTGSNAANVLGSTPMDFLKTFSEADPKDLEKLVNKAEEEKLRQQLNNFRYQMGGPLGDTPMFP
jgi:hypothetical protein